MNMQQARAVHPDGSVAPPYDVAYFAAHPDATWRVRRRVPGEFGEHDPGTRDAPPSDRTHVLVVYNRAQQRYAALPLRLPPEIASDEDAAREAAVNALRQNPPHWSR